MRNVILIATGLEQKRLGSEQPSLRVGGPVRLVKRLPEQTFDFADAGATRRGDRCYDKE